MPERRADLELYEGDEPIFDAYGIEEEISRALSRKVHLPSGGYLIIDQAEALTAIDVNTGRFVGSRDLEETILKTNLEAVSEIAYQLRFRNLGGLIILDFIDMDRAGNRE
jgi:ribonuclease G